MIQIQQLEIHEFRGIRHLVLDLKRKSFVVVGPNGSGKSGVVDAIGFALTGTIARLTGAGTAGISMKEHGPHVLRRDDPADAWVKLTFVDTATGKQGSVTRSVKTATTYTLEPDDSALRATVERVACHPELTLSRRELIRFILANAGTRASEVQALLQLDGLEDRRKALKRAFSLCSSDTSHAEGTLTSARQAVGRHLDLPQLDPAEVMRVLNEPRSVLGMAALTELTLDTDLREGLASTPGEVAYSKSGALRDLDAYEVKLAEQRAAQQAAAQVERHARELREDATVAPLLRHRDLVVRGLALLDGTLAACPLCDLVWPTPAELREHLQSKVEQSDAAAARIDALEGDAAGLVTLLRSERPIAQLVRTLAASWGTPEIQAEIGMRLDQLAAVETKLGTLADNPASFADFTADELDPRSRLAEALMELRRVLEALPDTSARQGARDFLTIAADRWNGLRQARRAHDRAARISKLAEAVYRHYCTEVDAALTGLYSQVESRFSAFYRLINADDESGFKAELAPSTGSLDLRVDFYGHGMFPPGAYHSEGHQDGMAVCLYLALLERLLGTDFRLAVLDDVVMSVDGNHRRQFCELLKREFPDVQFVITTHDEVWAKQMQATGLVTSKARSRFFGWTVEDGPAVEIGRDIWDRIQEDLVRDDVPSAAHKLRRGLEGELPELTEGLRGHVPFRGDGRYELGDFLGGVKGRHNDWLKKADKSARSWNADLAPITALQDARVTAVLAQDGEQWAINAAVHDNDWAAMTKADFQPVVQAWRELLALFRCGNAECESWIAVTGAPGREDALRCDCGAYNLNLITKP